MIAVITTIQKPTESVNKLVDKLNGDTLIVIGDKKTPPFILNQSIYYSYDYPWEYKLAKLLKSNHYQLKNLGYLEAMRMASFDNVIYETDDDTYPSNFWKPRKLWVEAKGLKGENWVNIYKWFTDQDIWPRGFPLNCVKQKKFEVVESIKHESPIQQCLVNKSPDVDSIWRLLYGQDFYFDFNFSVFSNSYCPFNSQNTWWFKEAFPLMYLPSYCNFRQTDIWRSLIAQRCLWQDGYMVSYHAADAIQNRNPHDLLEDFKDEVQGHLLNDKIVKILTKTELSEDIYTNLLICYKTLVNNEILPKEELLLVNAWIEDCKNILE
jgi:hypothetical protein